MNKQKGGVERVADVLRSQIQKGEFGTRGKLPAIAEIGRENGVNRQTAWSAVQLLIGEGLIILKNKRYSINYPILDLPGIVSDFGGWIKAQGLSPKIENLVEPGVMVMEESLRALFQTDENTFVYRKRLQGTESVAYRIAEIWYPASLVLEYVPHMTLTPSLNVLQLIENEKGLVINETIESEYARIPSVQEAELLGIIRQAPVLEILRRNYADGQLIMLNRIVQVGAFFRVTHTYHPSPEFYRK